MKYAIVLLLLCSCASQRNMARDPEVQLALKGISNNFQKYHLTPESLADKLNSTNWELYINPPGAMNCNWAQACTHIRKDKIIVELPNTQTTWKECPSVSFVFYHELYHIALKFYQGFSDPVHIDKSWGLVEKMAELKNPCAVK